jgi:dTDP-4-dehydrorhamnose reductase
MTPKVLILGATGMLGHTLMRELAHSKSQEIFGTIRNIDLRSQSLISDFPDRIFSGIDASEFDAVSEILSRLQPNVVINCIGVIKQDPAVNDSLKTITINSLLPHFLERSCAAIGARLVHISTDCVFSGNHGNYAETDNPDPLDLYGRSKLLGEVTGPSSLTLRTSLIGHEIDSARSLVDWFLSQSDTVHGYTQAIYSGLTTTEFGKFLQSIVIPRNDLTGLFHLASAPISKYELLSMIASQYGWTGDLVPFDEFVCDRSLSSNALFAKTGYRAPAWKQMIIDMYSSRESLQSTNEPALDEV